MVARSAVRRRTLGVLGVLCLLAISAPASFSATAASAQRSQGHDQPTLVSEDPAESTPDVLDGSVLAIAVAGNTVVLGGSFTRVQNSPGAPVRTRAHLLSFDAATGRVIREFRPHVNGTVTSLATGPHGSVYVGGEFTKVNGRRYPGVVRIRLSTGRLFRDFRPPAPNGGVSDLAYESGRVFIAGGFDRLGRHRRTALAELAPIDGAVRPSLDLRVKGGHFGGRAQVSKLDVTPNGRRMVVVGNFVAVGGERRVEVAMLNLGGDRVRVARWRTGRFRPHCADPYYHITRDVQFAPDGSYFVIVATGAYSHGPPKLCDSASRWETAAHGGSVQPTWVDWTGGDSLYATVLTDTAVYVGGHQRWLNNPYAGNAHGPGAVPRAGIAALDPVNGLPLSWNPGRTRGHGVEELYATAKGLYMGSDTDKVAGEYHARIAYFPLAGGRVVPQPSPTSLPASIYLLGAGRSTTAIVRREFDGWTAGPGVRLPNRRSFADARASTLVHGTLYSAWSDGRLLRRPFRNGQPGLPSTVRLHGLHRFARAMQHATGMFYNHGRLYYTRDDRDGLYLRYFTVEDDVVGAREFTISSDTSAVPWPRVAGLFLAGGRLFWVDERTGALHRVRWEGGLPVQGSDVKVSGPQVDGLRWRANSIVAAKQTSS